jgi:hypothetical protein
MKADDIRELNRKLQEEGLKTESVGAQDAGMKSLVCSLLAELTAQVAEANVHLAKIANPLMAVDAESPWVRFSDGKTLVAIDRREVVGVRRSGPESEMMSQVDTRTGLYIVQGTVVEVCKKLGIPTQEGE